jgi:radical SAM protein (TIGR01212 family)
MVDATLEWVRRGHSVAQFSDAMHRTKARGLRVCVHIILGFPGETHAMMMQTAETLAGMDIDGIKIHHLYVSKHTTMEKMFRSGQIPLLTLKDYIPLVCDFLERIPEGVAVQRLMGEIEGEYLVAPHWHSRKQEILREIEGEFRRRGTRQGSRVSETASAVSQ